MKKGNTIASFNFCKNLVIDFQQKLHVKTKSRRRMTYEISDQQDFLIV